MAFNVCDRNGEHIGFICDRYPEQRDVLLVAVTGDLLDDASVDMENVLQQLASVYGCKGLLGKINEEKLGSVMVQKKEQNHNLEEMPHDDLVKYLFLKENTDVQKAVKADAEAIEGYLLLDVEDIRFRNGCVVMDEVPDYIDGEEIEEEHDQDMLSPYLQSEKSIRLYGRTVGHPIVKTEVMGVGEGLLLGANLSDFGGRNHSHSTKLRIRSGNCTRTFDLPFIVNARKGMPVRIYIAEKKIKKVFCDGVFYEL